MSVRLCRDPELWAIVVGTLARGDVRWWIFQSYGDREAGGIASVSAAEMLFGATLRNTPVPYR